MNHSIKNDAETVESLLRADLAALKAQNEELLAQRNRLAGEKIILKEALAGLIAEIGGLPHSLGYEFTHLPAARALLSRLNDKGEGQP